MDPTPSQDPPGGVTPPKGVRGNKKGQAKSANRAIRDAKIRLATELQLRGVSTGEVRKVMGVKRETLRIWNKVAREEGIVEDVREKLSKELVPKAAKVYNDILDAPDAVLEKASKSREIKLKAARDIAAGFGIFRKETSSYQKKITGTLDLEGYYGLRSAKADREPDGGDQADPILEGETFLETDDERIQQCLQRDDEPAAESEAEGGRVRGDLGSSPGQILLPQDGGGGDPLGPEGNRDPAGQAGTRHQEAEVDAGGDEEEGEEVQA